MSNFSTIAFAKKGLINANQSTDEIAQVLREEFLKLEQSIPDPVGASEKDWKEMYEEYVQIQENQTNRIPLSEFESKYAKFFSKQNIKKFTHRSATGQQWSYECEQFLKRINPYQPFFVVKDNDPDTVLLTFPPIFRQIDTLNISPDKNVRPIIDEYGTEFNSAELISAVNNIFDKYGNHQLPSKRREGALLLKNCLLNMQDVDVIAKDVQATDVIISDFVQKQNPHTSTSTETSSKNVTMTHETDESSLEDFGISFD